MKEKFDSLFKALGVEPKFKNPVEPTEAEMNAAIDMAIAAANKLNEEAEKKSSADAGEREIRSLMVESGHALTREGAKQVLADRKIHAAKQKEKRK